MNFAADCLIFDILTVPMFNSWPSNCFHIRVGNQSSKGVSAIWQCCL